MLHRILLILTVIVAYIGVIRPMRALFMNTVINTSFLNDLSASGINSTDKIPEKRSFSRKGITTLYSFRAPIDSYFILGILFVILFGVPKKWILLAIIAHVSLWIISYLLLRLAISQPALLAVIDGISTYVSPAVSLGVVPLWKMKNSMPT